MKRLIIINVLHWIITIGTTYILKSVIIIPTLGQKSGVNILPIFPSLLFLHKYQRFLKPSFIISI